MNKFVVVAITLACPGAISACAVDLQSAWHKLRIDPSRPGEVFSEQAAAKERSGKLREALLLWRAARQVEPGNAEVAQAVEALESNLAEAAADHFRRGMNHYQNGDYARARAHFLITIRHQPDHMGAIDYLKNRLHGRGQTRYRVRKGDSLEKIAREVYGDSTKAFVVAYFNDLDPDRPIRAGTVLSLPYLAPHYLRPRVDIEALSARARRLLKKGQYAEVLTIASQIEAEQPGHPSARQLADAALFGLGQRFFANAQYWHALEHFNGVSEDFEGLRQAIAETKKQIRTQAVHEKLELARQHLRSGDHRRAITVARAILDENATHQTATELLQKARYSLGQQLMSDGRDQEAIATLKQLDPAYKDTAALINDARMRLDSLAEQHYRIGVKYYINEELALAIKEWQATLRLNPDHPQARQDIDIARRLLQRLEAYDKRPARIGHAP